MIGIKYSSLADLNGQALAWCNKVNAKVHATTNEIPFERLKKEGLSPLKREYISTSAMIGDVNWLMVGSAALLAGILSLLISVAGLPEVNKKTE